MEETVVTKRPLGLPTPFLSQETRLLINSYATYITTLMGRQSLTFRMFAVGNRASVISMGNCATTARTALQCASHYHSLMGSVIRRPVGSVAPRNSAFVHHLGDSAADDFEVKSYDQVPSVRVLPVIGTVWAWFPHVGNRALF